MKSKYLCSVTEGAAIFNIGRDKLYELAKTNQIPCLQIGNVTKINVPMMEKFLEEAVREGRKL